MPVVKMTSRPCPDISVSIVTNCIYEFPVNNSRISKFKVTNKNVFSESPKSLPAFYHHSFKNWYCVFKACFIH